MDLCWGWRLMKNGIRPIFVVMITPIRSNMKTRRATARSLLRSKTRRPCRAFSLVELLVVLAIVGVLAAVIMPAVSTVRSQAQKSKNLSNLRQIHAACMMYAANNSGWLPPNGDGRIATAWWTQIYPDYIDDPAVFFCPMDDPEGISEANAQIEGNGKLSYGSMGNADSYSRNRGVMDKNLGDFIYAGKSIMLIDDPKTNRQLAKSWYYNWPRWTTDLQDVYDGKLCMAFVDGHVDEMTKSEIIERADEGELKVSYGDMNSRTPIPTN